MTLEHLTQGDYVKLFPDGIDEFPEPVDDLNYIDAWLLNTAFDSILSIEEYILLWKSNIEAPLGDDIIGIEGNLLIDIPPGRYPSYKQAMAWDSDLLAENIKVGINVFGVTGSLAASGGGVLISLPNTSVLNNALVFASSPACSLTSAVPSISVPGTSVA